MAPGLGILIDTRALKSLSHCGWVWVAQLPCPAVTTSLRAEPNIHRLALITIPGPQAWSHHLAFPDKFSRHQEKQIHCLQWLGFR